MRFVTYRVALTLAVLAALAVACDDDGPSATEGQVREHRAAIDGLCQTANSLGQGRTSQALDIFQDRTHVYLHDLIDRVEPHDRAVATELLESKHAAEIALKDPSFYGRREVAQRFTDLHLAVVRAGRVLGLPKVGCGA